ncbi:MAG: glycoside hydrolase family 140 protein, partial [Lewinella sp.]
MKTYVISSLIVLLIGVTARAQTEPNRADIARNTRAVPHSTATGPEDLSFTQDPSGPIRVSDNRRYFVQSDGAPFFWLGDTGWLLFRKLDREAAARYLDDRAANGFNVIQAMLLHELSLTNAYGDSALVAGNVARPVATPGNDPTDEHAYDYWDHVDYIIDMAAERGINVALVPVWGSNVRGGGVTEEQARQYATWLGKRYRDRPNVIWLNGGDTRGDQQTDIWTTIGQTLRQEAPGQLITFHPYGRTNSTTWFHDADWLDFNMFQSGHRRYDQEVGDSIYGPDNYKYVHDSYTRQPTKPTLDGEPSYESIPQGLHDPAEPYWTADDVRRYAYWSVFAGAAGFTYGHNAVMQMHTPGDTDANYGVRESWVEALAAPGARQMQHLIELMLSFPYFERIPDQQLIAPEQGDQYAYQVATRGEDYALVYTYDGRDATVTMGRIAGRRVTASWFNPRTGQRSFIGRYRNRGTRTFDPPGQA